MGTPRPVARQSSFAQPADDGLSHEDLGPQLNTVFWLLTTLASFFLALRLYCKFIRGRSLWWDDHLLIASWVGLDDHKEHFEHWPSS
jgi:hypothetical protein